MTIAGAWWAAAASAAPSEHGNAPAAPGPLDGRPPRLRRAVVLGAGTMGAQIACLLAGRGVRVDLLDLDAATAKTGLERAAGLSPAPLYLPDDVRAIRPAGFDALETVAADADWILEAVVERLEVKRDLLARVAASLAPHALLATNTSSLSV